MFREHRESSSTSFRELPGSMLGTALHVYRRASAAAATLGGAGTGAPSSRGGGGAGSGGVGAGVTAPRGRGGGGAAALRGRGGGVGKKEHKEVPPQSFALLTSMGIYHGSLALGSQVGRAWDV